MKLQELKAEAIIANDADTYDYFNISFPMLFKLIAVAEAVEYSGVAKDCQMIADALKELEK
jgi:hypothetical protein